MFAIASRFGLKVESPPDEMDFDQVASDVLEYGDNTFPEWDQPDQRPDNTALAAGLGVPLFVQENPKLDVVM